MTDNSPRITLSINRRTDGTRATGELNSLCLGFGLFQVWLYMAIFGASKLFTASTLIPGFPFLPEALGPVVLTSYLIANGIALIVLGYTNQIFLHFLVSKRALITATAISSIGTVLLFTTCIEGVGFALAIIAGAVMGIGSSLVIVLWGTAFSRYQFATIILNTAVASVLGVAVALICTNWVPSPISSLVTILLPVSAAPILWNLMPPPFYKLNKTPMFVPLQKNRGKFCFLIGAPVLIIGIPLGALRMVCVGEILPSGSITIQLLLGCACAVSIVIYIIAISLTKRDMFWDALFRCIIPITVLGIACIALLSTDLSLLGGFCASTGFICLDILMWVFFAGLAQEFRVSPIFIFGIGRGLLEIGSAIGSAFTPFSFTFDAIGPSTMSYFSLGIIVVLSIGYATLPRYRELRSMVSDSLEQDGAKAPEIDVADIKDASEIPGAATSAISEIDSTAEQPELTTAAAALREEDLPEGEETGSAASSKQEQIHEKGSFLRKCEELSGQYFLSRRETEVFVLLAKGHNAAFIQDKLCVSKSTAKTHINHIYKKLNIHNQQELLNMVEDRKRGPKGPGDPKQAPSRSEAASSNESVSKKAYIAGSIPADEKETLARNASSARKGVNSQQHKRPIKKNIFN